MDDQPEPEAHERHRSVADLNDESLGRPFDQTNGLADGLSGDSDGTAESEQPGVHKRHEKREKHRGRDHQV